MDTIPKDNHARFVDYMLGGAEDPGCKRLGFELEHFIVDASTKEAVPYSGAQGVGSLLRELSPKYERAISNGELIGLSRPETDLTLEPGSQLEISTGPYTQVSQIEASYERFRDELRPLLKKRGQAMVSSGYQPQSRAEDVSLIPKDRYTYMDKWFAGSGRHGINMMRGSAATQVSIDYSSEEDCIRKARIATILGPLLALLTDNSAVYEGKNTSSRMMRTQIWQDVDPARCEVIPHLFDPGFGFSDYADYLMSAPLILSGGDVPERFVGNGSAYDIYAEHELSINDIQHILSMFFFDVRIKHYLEIRVADCLPIEYALSYAALVKALLYSDENLRTLEEEYLVPLLTQGSVEAEICDAKRSLIEQGYHADVYGRPATEHIDALFALATQAYKRQEVTEDESVYLDPLRDLAVRRVTLTDIGKAALASDTVAKHESYTAIVQDLPWLDETGRKEASQYMAGSTGIYHGEVTDFLYVPKLYPAHARQTFKQIVDTTYKILSKVTDQYVADKEYRALFGFPKELEELILLDPGYRCPIPIMRMDIFFDEETMDFKFCEFNTDGTSAMNEDREVTAALQLTPSFREMQKQHELEPFELFDSWVHEFSRIYDSYKQPVDDPYVALVDFLDATTPEELEEFRARFDHAGYRVGVHDIRDLDFRNGSLWAGDVRLDVIYRRAVTTDVMEHFDEVQDFLEAVKNEAVCLIGSFRTQVAHSKTVFEVLHLQQTQAFLTDEEREFVAKHVPYTAELTPDLVERKRVVEDKDAWILKPRDGYAAAGVYAGVDHTTQSWRDLVEANLGGAYLLQEYVDQYQDSNIDPGYVMIQNEDVVEKATRTSLLSYKNLTGLYVYGGSFAGVLSRAGRAGTICAAAGGYTLGSFKVD